MRPLVLPIYARKGIGPEVASGLRHASALLRQNGDDAIRLAALELLEQGFPASPRFFSRFSGCFIRVRISCFRRMKPCPAPL